MKKATKRLTALLLVASMCLSLLSANVWAGAFETDRSSVIVQNEEDVSIDENVENTSQPKSINSDKNELSSDAAESVEQNIKGQKKNDTIHTQEELVYSYGSLFWSHDDNTGTLTISGNGDMESKDHYGYYPWWIDAESIQKVIIKEGVTSIGDYAFEEYDGLQEVTLPESLKVIGSSAFLGCDNLKRIVIPGSVETIGRCAFSECKKLAMISLLDGLKVIKERAFSRCDSLRQIQIPNSVTEIEKGALEECELLESVVLPSGIKTISDELFSSDINLANITIPQSVERIGRSSFYECKAIKSIILPSSISEIGRGAFFSSGITSMVFPASVTLIDEYVFDGHSYENCVDALVFKGSPPVMWESTFECVEASAYYPEAYADRWTETVRESCRGDLTWYPYCHMENGEIIKEHRLDAGTITKEPTYEQSGIKTYTCSYCGISKTEILPNLVKEPTPISECTITLSQSQYTYDGKAKTPTVTVVDNGVTVNSTNYTVTYSNNVNAGTAVVKITGTGDLTGTTTKTFVISKAQQSMNVELADNAVYKGKTTNVICNGIGSLTYSVDNTSIATVNSSGKVTGVSAGTTNITVLASGNSNYESAIESVKITVLPPAMTKKEAEKLYAPVLDMFYYNIKTNWKYYKEKSPGNGRPRLEYVSYMISSYMTSKSESKHIGYCFRDINSDGTPELLISISGAKNNEGIYDLYTSSGGHLYHLAYGGERYQYYLLSDGSLKFEEGYGEYSDNIHYRLKKNGNKLTFLEEVCDSVEYDDIDSDDGYRTIHHITEDGKKSITESQMNAIMNEWGKKTKFNSTLFSKYTPKSKTAVYEVVSSSLSKTTLKSLKSSKSKSVDVTWKKNTKGKGYQIQCSTDKAFLKNVKTVNVKGNGTVKTTVKGLKKGTWYVRICTINGSSYSSWSSGKSVKVK